MKRTLLFSLLLTVSLVKSFAHSDTPLESNAFEAEGELYAGKRGYLHMGLGITTRWDEHRVVGLSSHVVREEDDAEEVPSLGVFLRQGFEDGTEITMHSFGYFPVERQYAWAVGLRGSKQFALGEDRSITPFIGSTYSQVKAFDEEAEAADSVHHLLFLGGVTVAVEAFDLTLFASQSLYSRSVRGLESHVDLQEMTQMTAYENVDGFARNSVGAQVSYALTDWLTLTVCHAAVRFEDHTRHATMLRPSVRMGKHLEIFGGVQFLRGGEEENDLVFGGMSVKF